MNEYHGMDPKTITVSKINTYLSCSAQYYFQYIEKVKAYSRSSLLFGSAFHSAEATNDTQKIVSDVDLPVDEVCDVFSTQFDEGGHETLFMQDEDKGKLKDDGYGLIQCYHKVMTPNIHPKAVEAKFELKLSNTDMVFAGKMDVITKNDQIIERKTKRAKPSSVEGSHKLQLTAYQAGYQVTYKEKPKEARLDYCIMKKTPECLSYVVGITDTDIEYLGRPLKCNEVVHHKNGDTSDNRVENLELIGSKGLHTSLHNHIRLEAKHKGGKCNANKISDLS